MSDRIPPNAELNAPGDTAGPGGEGLPDTRPGGEERPADTGLRGRIASSLSAKLLLLTILFVMIAEVLIYVPSIANFRDVWLHEKLESAAVAAIVASAGPENGLPQELQREMLDAIGLESIALRSHGQRMLIASGDMPKDVAAHYDLTELRPLASVAAAFATLFATGERFVTVAGDPPAGSDGLDVVIRESALRKAMLVYSRNILVLSLAISLFSATLVYLALNRLIVRPITRIGANMAAFSAAPEEPGSIIEPSRRSDEIGLVEDRLASMQHALGDMLHKQRHLADLGLAVSKINHDLRNILASAQLFSDRLGSADDPVVQRVAPKIVGTIDRAIGYTTSVLSYGQANEEPPKRRLVRLAALIDDVADVLSLPGHDLINWENRVPDEIEIDADPDQLFRALMNLCRNAMEALSRDKDPAVIRRLWVEAERRGGVVTIRICDTGPGVPERARKALFQPFRGSARPGGTGLGLAIAAEITHAHGGEIRLVDHTSAGAVFELTLPDRPVKLDELRRANRTAN